MLFFLSLDEKQPEEKTVKPNGNGNHYGYDNGNTDSHKKNQPQKSTAKEQVFQNISLLPNQENVSCEANLSTAAVEPSVLQTQSGQNTSLALKVIPKSTTKKGRKRKRESSKSKKQTCSQCSARDTPKWRKIGDEIMCNACGLQFVKHRNKSVDPNENPSVPMIRDTQENLEGEEISGGKELVKLEDEEEHKDEEQEDEEEQENEEEQEDEENEENFEEEDLSLMNKTNVKEHDHSVMQNPIEHVLDSVGAHNEGKQGDFSMETSPSNEVDESRNDLDPSKLVIEESNDQQDEPQDFNYK